jgi:phenylacetate-CoA ligase
MKTNATDESQQLSELPTSIPDSDDVDGWITRRRTFYYPFALDFERLLSRYPPFEDYVNTTWKISEEELRSVQDKRFRAQAERGWQIPFYRRIWSATGLEPGDVDGLDDIEKLPIISVYDLRADLDEHPPFGTFQVANRSWGNETPLRLVTSGGTTGVPRPMFYPAWDREVSAVIGSRVFYLHGVRPGMIVHIANGLSTVNGGIHGMECIWKYCGAVPLTTGGGNATPTDMQVQMARAYGSDCIVGFADYVRHIGERAREIGIDPAVDLNIRIVSTMLGRQDRGYLEELYGAKVFDSYGTSEVGGHVSTECEAREGRHVLEDAYHMEIIDKATSQRVPNGTPGSIVITSLFKAAAPMIRYNTNDLSAFIDGTCECGSAMKRHDAIMGRTDDLVKIKGMWVHPEAVGEIVAGDARGNREFVCILEAVPRGRQMVDSMTVLVEALDGTDRASFASDLQRSFKSQFGVTVEVQCVSPGELEGWTEGSSARSGKTRRLIDRREKD